MFVVKRETSANTREFLSVCYWAVFLYVSGGHLIAVGIQLMSSDDGSLYCMTVVCRQ